MLSIITFSIKKRNVMLYDKIQLYKKNQYV